MSRKDYSDFWLKGDTLGSLILKHFLKPFAATLFFLMNHVTIIKSFYKIRFLKSHLRFELGGIKPPPDNCKVLIFAVFPREALLPSVRRLVNFALAQKYHVLLVLNESRDRLLYLESFHDLQNDITILSRENIGRDFGAYQCAINYLSDEMGLGGIKSLAFFNDSIFFGHNFSWFSQFENLGTDFSALFANYQDNYHLQSMALMLNEQVVNSPEFKNFWEHYYPTEIRHNVIRRGEKHLSTILRDAGFTDGNLALDLIGKELHPMTPLEQRMLVCSILKISQEHELCTRVSGGEFSKSLEFKLPNIVTGELVNLAFTRRNVSHAMGVYFFRNHGFPLKLDLARFGLLGLTDITYLFQEISLDPTESKLLTNHFIGAVSHHKPGFINFFLSRYNYV